MKTPALVIIKPDGITKNLVGPVISKFAKANLEMIAIRTVKTTRELVENHYRNIKGKPFFKDVVDYLLGKFHKSSRIVIIVYYGADAIKKCRKIAGATNPEEADPESVRGAFGRITTKGVFENVVHVSSDNREAEREIKLWFEPEDIPFSLYPTKAIQANSVKKRVWA
jgi:nucleoside-diphosphate kinase